MFVRGAMIVQKIAIPLVSILSRFPLFPYRDLVEKVGYSTLSRRSKPSSGGQAGPLGGGSEPHTETPRDPVLEHQVALELKLRMNVYVFSHLLLWCHMYESV